MNRESSITHQAGFTLVELLITMAVFVFVIAAATSLFVPLLTQFKQQSKMAETNIEGVVGLDIMRRDIEHAGYGLPWNIPSGTTYSEASSTTPCGTANPSTYNDSTANPPRAVVSGNNNCTNGSDYLVIKAVNVATNDPSSKWTELVYATACVSPYSNFATNVCKRTWSSSNDDLLNSDYVVVISPGTPSTTTERLLQANSGAYTGSTLTGINTSWLPTSSVDNIRFVYGLMSSGNAPLRPFNRADYYISTSSGTVPQRCAPNTGVLQKATMDYAGGFTQLPLLDCVADMQVVYQLAMNADPKTCIGTVGTQSNANGSTVTSSESATSATVQATLADASLLRCRLKEVRVYVLAHEGQIDRAYTYPSSTVNIPASSLDPGWGLGRGPGSSAFNLASVVGTDWANYRWKIYTIVVKPMDLGQ